MKKVMVFLFALLIMFVQTACNKSDEWSEPAPAISESSESTESAIETIEKEDSSITDVDTSLQISVQSGDNIVVFELNDSTAARELFAQLPLTMPVEDYSDNEKIFYPPEKLNTANTPLATNGIGTLAYYEPWGDVVFFYGDFTSTSSALYELGQVVSGGEHIESMSGAIQIDTMEIK